MKKVLILEDEPAISEFIEINLRLAGYETVIANTGEEALKIVEADDNIAIAILDIMLPGIDGLQVCKHIRLMGRNMGIIMLSARSQEMDKVAGLMIGADDYVPKPFSVTELIARVDSLSRRLNTASPESSTEGHSPAAPEFIHSGRFSLDLHKRILLKDEKPVDLTQIEFVIIKYFLENQDKAISREEMLSAVWGNEYYGDAKIVDVNLRRLRVKIEDDPANPVHLVTIWGYGYKWME